MFGYDVLLYTGDNTKIEENNENHYQRKSRELLDINNKWKECQLLIYTSTITAGVDFNQNHFDKFIHVYNKMTCDAFSFI